jgi:RNA-directed DNA polymerase
MRFTALYHHVYEIELLWRSYLNINKDAAPGVDGEMWESYGENLEENLRDLSERLKRGAYRAKPVKRVYIPKPDGRQRPLGITALEDKIVQRATVEVLNAIYESDFYGFSYGFRPGRHQHKALDALYVGLQTRKVSWVLDADVRDSYGSISHEWLIKFIEHRIADVGRQSSATSKTWKNGFGADYVRLCGNDGRHPSSDTSSCCNEESAPQRRGSPPVRPKAPGA